MDEARAERLSLRSEALGFLLLLALAFAVYAPSLPGGFVSDDVLYVQQNELLDLPPATALPRILQQPFFANWAPVHVFFLYAERASFGETPLGYRIANILLFAACAGALRRLALRGGATARGALLAAILLVIHPAAIEAVAWISQSKTLLALLFSLLALERWLAHLRSPSAGRLVAVLVLATVALLAKGAVVLLPVVLAVAWYSHAGGRRRDTWAVALLGLLSAYVTLLNLHAQSTQGGIVEWFGGSAAATLRILPSVLWRYLRMTVLPWDPVFCVQPEPVASWLDARVWLPLFGIAVAVALCGLAARRDRRSWLALAWVAAMLLPVLQLVPMTTVYADRYLALALPGLLLLVAEPASRMRAWHAHPRAARSAAVLLVLLLAGQSAWQARLWAEPEALFLQTIEAYPSSRHGWTGLGGERHQRGALTEAADAYRRALAIDPHDGHVHYLLARLRLQQGASEQALFHLEAALRDGPRHPDVAWMRARIAELRGRGIAAHDDPE